MTVRSMSTAKFLCHKAHIAREELTLEAQKLFDLYNDPNVAPEQKEIARQQLDEAIEKLEKKVTTRRLPDQKKEDTP
jgi:hypothetical protein